MLWWRECRRGWWADQDNAEKVARIKHATKKQGSRLMSAFLTPDPSIPYSWRHPCSRVGLPVEIRLRHRSQWAPSFAGRWPGKGSTQMNRTRGRIGDNCGHQCLFGHPFGRLRGLVGGLFSCSTKSAAYRTQVRAASAEPLGRARHGDIAGRVWLIATFTRMAFSRIIIYSFVPGTFKQNLVK